MPATMAPPPIPFRPSVSSITRSRAAPHRTSPSTAPFTSVSNATSTLRARFISPTMSKFCHPAFGVDVIWPSERSTGPKRQYPAGRSACLERSRSLSRCLHRSGCRKLNSLQILGARPHAAHELRPARLHSAETCHCNQYEIILVVNRRQFLSTTCAGVGGGSHNEGPAYRYAYPSLRR